MKSPAGHGKRLGVTTPPAIMCPALLPISSQVGLKLYAVEISELILSLLKEREWTLKKQVR
jgi:hypothetical protein